MSGFLFGVEPTDVIVLAGVTAILGSVGLLATYVPARRAARMAPAAVLHSE